MKTSSNPLLNIEYESVMEDLGDDYYDLVAAAEFPAHFLRFRNDQLLPLLGLDQDLVGDAEFIDAFGKFSGVRPFLALRYHGYQFGAYNPFLGDGRGFLYGQFRGSDGNLYDLGTKGSGRTPYSRSADGRLTLKGGIREVLAGEALHQLGVKTSRCLSLIETGESLWRSDEPSPTRSSVMVRLNESHIRFGTLERLHYLERSDLISQLLDSVIAVYYPDISDTEDKYSQFYAELVNRVAQLAAQWMAAGFGLRDLGIECRPLRADNAAAGAKAKLQAARSAVPRCGVDRDVIRVDLFITEFLRTRFEHLVIIVTGQAFDAVCTGHAHAVLSPVIPRREFIVVERPVGQIGAFHIAVG